MSHPRTRSSLVLSVFLMLRVLLNCVSIASVVGLSQPTTNTATRTVFSSNQRLNTTPDTVSFSVPLSKVRPQSQSASDTFWSLWNDKRSLASVIRDNNNAKTTQVVDDKDKEPPATVIPYCIVSDPFLVSINADDSSMQQEHSFQILLYPRGVISSTEQPLEGTPASAYLSYQPSKAGDEVDVAWKLRLVDGDAALPIETSGGLPASPDTWSAAMTLCTNNEAVDSLGRASDWGSSIWSSQQVCDALAKGNLKAEGELSIFEARTSQRSLQWPPKGALGAAQRAIQSRGGQRRDFRAGEIVIPVVSDKNGDRIQHLQRLGVYLGVDYRIMTLMDGHGTEIFATDYLSDSEYAEARLALRPVGWKLQQQLWKTRGRKEWPIEIQVQDLLQPIKPSESPPVRPASLDSEVQVLTRYNGGAFLPRFRAFLQQDVLAVVFALTLALSPIPTVLFAREYVVSLYAIPSASMEPTLMKGDLLLVEKLPGVYSRTHRGDIILFQPPSKLLEIANRRGNAPPIGKNQVFVKRLVGLPGDGSIEMDPQTQTVTVGGQPAAGPVNRRLCADEPLRLLDKLLDEYGEGTSLPQGLGPDEAYVLGDCQAVSVDSRVFGPLPTSKIVGRPVARLWPLDRFTLGAPR